MKTLSPIVLFVGAMIYMLVATAKAHGQEYYDPCGPRPKTLVGQLFKQGVLKPTPKTLAIIRPPGTVVISGGGSETYTYKKRRFLGAELNVESHSVEYSELSVTVVGPYYTYPPATSSQTTVYASPQGITRSSVTETPRPSRKKGK